MKLTLCALFAHILPRILGVLFSSLRSCRGRRGRRRTGRAALELLDVFPKQLVLRLETLDDLVRLLDQHLFPDARALGMHAVALAPDVLDILGGRLVLGSSSVCSGALHDRARLPPLAVGPGDEVEVTHLPLRSLTMPRDKEELRALARVVFLFNVRLIVRRRLTANVDLTVSDLLAVAQFAGIELDRDGQVGDFHVRHRHHEQNRSSLSLVDRLA
mmetsp:Transcript_16674/g.30225  ORF Transcript_16674/g.30225 Transcript_16674/m.30225 type:complete len:216 (+) Transcript_16674:318-965(+)